MNGLSIKAGKKGCKGFPRKEEHIRSPLEDRACCAPGDGRVPMQQGHTSGRGAKDEVAETAREETGRLRRPCKEFLP